MAIPSCKAHPAEWDVEWKISKCWVKVAIWNIAVKNVLTSKIFSLSIMDLICLGWHKTNMLAYIKLVYLYNCVWLVFKVWPHWLLI